MREATGCLGTRRPIPPPVDMSIIDQLAPAITMSGTLRYAPAQDNATHVNEDRTSNFTACFCSSSLRIVGAPFEDLKKANYDPFAIESFDFVHRNLAAADQVYQQQQNVLASLLSPEHQRLIALADIPPLPFHQFDAYASEPSRLYD